MPTVLLQGLPQVLLRVVQQVLLQVLPQEKLQELLRVLLQALPQVQQQVLLQVPLQVRPQVLPQVLLQVLLQALMFSILRCHFEAMALVFGGSELRARRGPGNLFTSLSGLALR